jgi:hypothetical protein
MLYGFPPGVGATGTAALLNVPKSIENMIAALQVTRGAGTFFMGGQEGPEGSEHLHLSHQVQ